MKILDLPAPYSFEHKCEFCGAKLLVEEDDLSPCYGVFKPPCAEFAVKFKCSNCDKTNVMPFYDYTGAEKKELVPPHVAHKLFTLWQAECAQRHNSFWSTVKNENSKVNGH